MADSDKEPVRLPNVSGPAPETSDWPASLADHDALWCVFCLKPIHDVPPGVNLDYPFSRLEAHHPFLQAKFKTQIKKPLFPSAFPLGWTVPAHATCHSVHDTDAWAVADYVLRALKTTKLQERDDWARKSHDAGLYWHALAMNADSLRRFHDDLQPEDRATLMERQLSSASGVRSRVHPFPEWKIHATVPPEHRTRVLYHLVNRQANRGHQKAAKATFDRAQSFRRAARGETAERIELSSRLRKAQIDRTVRTGLEAMAEAVAVVGTSSYSYLTSLLLLAWNELSEERREAMSHFEEVLASQNWASWLYIAEALFGKSCCAILWGQHGAGRVYQWLVQAQYIYVMLGLQVTPHTLLPVGLGVPRDVSCFPGHLLVSGRFSSLSPQERFRLRTVAIGVEDQGDWLYGALQEALCGKHGHRGRIALL